MAEEKKQPQEEKSSDTKADQLQWEKKTKSAGIFELLQPIVGNFVLLIEEERKRTIDQVDKAKKSLERMKNNR